MKILCIGRNYVDHAKELNNPVPKKPLVFMKPSTALLVNNKPFYYPEFSKEIHYEVEVVLKICRNGRHIQPAFASKYYEEIGLGIDFTARDIQRQCKEKGHPWEIAKAFDNSAAMSKFVSKDQFDPKAMEFGMTKNGEEVQKGNTKDLIFPFDELICYTSQFFKLHVGDFIFTGTPAGVGPVQIGDQLDGFLINAKKEKLSLLSCEIK